MKSVQQLQTILHYHFKDEELLQTAVTHRSYSKNKNNETLEFLGDSVLGLVISGYIFKRLDKAAEGELSRVRASLVKEEALATVARDINLGDFLLLGSGELKSGGYRRASILSDALEAIFGAIYLDAGFSQCQKSILFLYEDYLVTLPSSVDLKDPKTSLQEYLQGRKIDLPVYQVIKTEGKSHDQIFTIECSVSGLDIISHGRGSSRKKAEQMAASTALKQASNG
ncbi:MAG: ribonuclease III [Gammaproteobacteria bacterium]|nr:ribonuclease III [Gammaproteobacteria bacterium]